MDEKRQIAILIAVAFGIVVGACILALAVPMVTEGDLVIADYQATLYRDGTFNETYLYEVTTPGQYRMLYRYWDDPLALGPLNVPFIELKGMEVPPPAIGYVKEYDGMVSIYNGDFEGYTEFIGYLAERNEVGIFEPSYFSTGIYEVNYSYLLHPPLEYDTSSAHLNLKLVGDQHISFREVTIRVPSDLVESVYPHPPSLTVREDGAWIVISGSVPADEVIGVEMLLSMDALESIPGFPVFTEDVVERTADANPWYAILPILLAKLLLILGFAGAIITPFFLLYVYYRYGREQEFTVPEYLSTIPNPTMKPWEVNLLFKGDATVFDEDGYYATLIDMHRKKMITIIEDGWGNVRVSLHAKESEDPYEQSVLTFLGEIASDGIVNSANLEILASKAKSDQAAERKMLKYQKNLAALVRRSDPSLISHYVVDGREHIFPALFAGIVFCVLSFILILIAGILAYLIIPAIILFGSVIVQSGVALAFPSTLFGYWKGDSYKEKLEWDAFAKFLSDLAMLRKYAPADISMWGTWLVYGTALGVGDRVEKAMKELNISIPETIAPATGARSAFLPVLYFSPPSRGGGGSSGGFGGGSFGGGGGFGGGGVGGR